MVKSYITSNAKKLKSTQFNLIIRLHKDLNFISE